MKAKELAAVSGKTVTAIRGAYYRFYDTKTGWSQARDLKDDFVNYILKSSSDDEPRPKPNRKSESKNEPNKEFQTEPQTELSTEQDANRTEPNRLDDQNEVSSKPDLQTEPAKQFDIGDVLMFHPSAQFTFVIVILSAGAYIFASLAGKLYPDEFNAITFAMFFGVGFLVDASGVIFAQKYKRADKWDDATLVHVCLVVLFCVQIWIESSYMFYEKAFTWSGFAAVCVRPLGQFIYSEIYLNS